MIKTAIALLLINTITASFEYQETNPASLFPYHNAVSGDNPAGNLSNPAYLPLWKTLYINMDYARPYWMEELDAGSLRLGAGHNDFAVQASWSKFGIEEYNENTFTGSAGYMPFTFLSIGASASYYIIKINTEELESSSGTADFSASALIMPVEWLRLSFIQTNIYSAFNREREDMTFPAWSAGLSIKPAQGITFMWNTNRLYFDMVNTFSVSVNLLKFLNLNAGYSRETSTYAASFIINIKNLMVSYCLNHHSYLGLTHKLGVTIFSDPSPFEPVKYDKKLYRETLPASKKKLDINTSTLEEILDSALFSETIARRIIKYRAVFGPVSATALLQIGVTPDELKKIETRIIGLAPERSPDSTQSKYKKPGRAGNHKKNYLDMDERKELFKRLLALGLSASDSLKITDMARDKTIEEILSIINKTDFIPEKHRAAVIKICRELF